MYDVIVVGLGAIGAAAAYELGKRGARVLGIERFDTPNVFGSHHGRSRIFRMSYFEHPDYVPLLQRAYELWRQLEHDAGCELLTLSGALFLGQPESPLLAGCLQSARLHGLQHESLSSSEIADRFPQFVLPSEFIAVHELKAGFISPEKAIGAQAQLCRSIGVAIHNHERCISWQAETGSITVITEHSRYKADKLIVCVGAYSNELLQDAGVSITPTQQATIWLRPHNPYLFTQDIFPVWAIELPNGIYYGAPYQSEYGLKLSIHDPGLSVLPDEVNRNGTTAAPAELLDFAAQHLPGAGNRVAEVELCLYENSPDGHFIVDWHPASTRVVLACGFSGHGFKFAPAIGEVLAELVLSGESTHNIDFLGLSRFNAAPPDP